MTTKTNKTHSRDTASQITLVIVLGVAGGIGKSLLSDVLASLFQASGLGVKTVRVETGARRAEFPAADDFIDLDAIGKAEHAVGGASSLFDGAWSHILTAIKNQGIVILDGGANSHHTILSVAGETGLAKLVQARGAATYILVLATPDADTMKQTAALVHDVSERMPEANIIIALNERDRSFAFDDHTLEGRIFATELQPLLKTIPHITIPEAGAKALGAFAASGRTMLDVMAATETELTQWSGLGLLRALSCQAHLAAWWEKVTNQLLRVLPFRGPSA